MFNNLLTVVRRESRNGAGRALLGDCQRDAPPLRLPAPTAWPVRIQAAYAGSTNKGTIKIVTEGMQDWAYLPEDWEAIENRKKRLRPNPRTRTSHRSAID